jgi:molecular chaperone IbpA
MTNLFADTFGAFRDLDRVTSAMLRGVEPGIAPAYDVLRTGKDAFEVIVAVPGYRESELNVSVENGDVVIRGEAKAETNGDAAWLYRGIVRGRFERRFALAEHVEVKDAKLENGLLRVKLAREVPEAMKPRSIAINAQPALTQAA